eukprot:Gb_15799 [translate_table: standard]
MTSGCDFFGSLRSTHSTEKFNGAPPLPAREADQTKFVLAAPGKWAAAWNFLLPLGIPISSWNSKRQQKIPSGSPFNRKLGSTLADLKQNTAFSGYDYKTSRAERGTCKQSISQPECTACLSNLINRIFSICKNAIDARVQLVDYFILDEQSSF